MKTKLFGAMIGIAAMVLFATVPSAGVWKSIQHKHRVMQTEQMVSIIKILAPKYDVPTWFALRIAKVESNYNPRARGLQGEYGIYQLKCETAQSIGYGGACSGLLNPYTNIKFGLRHLQKAIELSKGDMKLAASKHNGGLGRKTLVVAYVDLVF